VNAFYVSDPKPGSRPAAIVNSATPRARIKEFQRARNAVPMHLQWRRNYSDLNSTLVGGGMELCPSLPDSLFESEIQLCAKLTSSLVLLLCLKVGLGTFRYVSIPSKVPYS